MAPEELDRMTKTVGSVLKLTFLTFPRILREVEATIRATKTCMLYADHVELLYPNSTMILSIASIPSLTDSQRIFFLQQLLFLSLREKSTAQDNLNLLEKFVALLLNPARSSEETILMHETADQIEEALRQTSDRFEAAIVKTSYKDLSPATDKGLFNIRFIQRPASGSPLGSYVPLFLNAVQDSIVSGETYPVFDDNIGRLVATISSGGKLEVQLTDKERMSFVAFTNRVLEGLPNLSTIPTEALLEIRDRLKDHLARFRAAMVNYSKGVSAFPLNREFRKQSEAIIMSEIAPAVEEIRERVKSNRLIMRLLRAATTDPVTVLPSSGLGIAVTHLSTLPLLSAIGIGAATDVVASAVKAGFEWHRENIEIQKNQLFLYYRANQILSK